MEYLTVKEASVFMNMNIKLLRHYLRDGRIKYVRQNGLMQIRKHDIYLFLKRYYFESAMRKIAQELAVELKKRGLKHREIGIMKGGEKPSVHAEVMQSKRLIEKGHIENPKPFIRKARQKLKEMDNVQ